MYLDILRDCYLLRGCTPQFINQLLSVVRMELFMPNVSAHLEPSKRQAQAVLPLLPAVCMERFMQNASQFYALQIMDLIGVRRANESLHAKPFIPVCAYAS